ncbi:hypothetical protein C3L33_06822, partial [Rhododendron williamsianum]
MEGDKPLTATLMCTVVAVDHTHLCYRVCSLCEKTLPETDKNNNTSSSSSSSSSSACKYCNAFNPVSSNPKRLFRVLMSIASDTKVFVVVMFDRAARVLFGCSADEFFDFAKLHPFSGTLTFSSLTPDLLSCVISFLGMQIQLRVVVRSFAETAAKALEGEMLRVTLSKPKNGNAQHQRVVSVVPLRSGFRPAMRT